MSQMMLDRPAAAGIGVSGLIRFVRRYALVLFLVAFLAIFFVAPIAQMAIFGFYKYHPLKLIIREFTLANYASLVADPYVRGILFRTVRLAAIATVVSAALGFVVASRMQQARGLEKMILALVVLSPLMISPIVLAYAWLVILAPNTGLMGFAFRAVGVGAPRVMFTEYGVLLGLVYSYTVFMVLSLHASLENIDRSIIRAAQTLGASPVAVFLRIVLPLSLPGLVSGSLLVFAISTSSFLMPLILGGRQVPVLATYAYDLASFVLNWPAASAIAIGLALLTIATVAAYTLWIHALQKRLGIVES